MTRGNASISDPMSSDLDFDVLTNSRRRRPGSKAFITGKSGKNPWTLSKSRRKRSKVSKVSTVEHLHIDGRKIDEETSARTTGHDVEDDKLPSGDELPLSDPRSWIWKHRGDAKVAVVIESRDKTVPKTPRYAPYMNSDSEGGSEDGDAVPGKPKGRLWLHKVESR